MITVLAQRCDGCGACLEVCPHGALYMIDGKAVVDEARCEECEACVAVCPTAAIVIVEQKTTSTPAGLPAIRARPEVLLNESPSAPVLLRASLLPVVGAALGWVGRELVPRLAVSLLDGLDRRVTGKPTTDLARGGRSSGGSAGRGRQQRHRHRGGRGNSR